MASENRRRIKGTCRELGRWMEWRKKGLSGNMFTSQAQSLSDGYVSSVSRASGDIRGAFREHSVQSYPRSEEHTSELQSHSDLVCRLLLEKKNNYLVLESMYKS